MSNETGLNKLIKLEKIGEGSYGEVFKAKDEETNEIYAVKIFRNEFSMNSRDYLNSLLNEAKLFSKLDHPAILPFVKFSYFSFDDEQRPAIVTKYAENGSLDQIIQFGKQYPIVNFFDNTKKLCIIYGIASAILYLHKENIAHLDLKPANILLDEYLLPLVCDFGLAKTLDKDQKNFPLNTTTDVRGTPTHVAPESWKKNIYSPACDTYAFSLVLYSIFTNEEPFSNYNQFQFFMEVINNGKRPELNSKIPEPFKKLITKSWSENPEERPNFEWIVSELTENPEYLIDGVDKDQYFKYVDLIKQCKKSQEKDIKNNFFEKVNIKDEIEKEPEIGIAFESLFTDTIEELNDLPLKKQETIKKIIFNQSTKVNFSKIHINSDDVYKLYKEETLNSPYLINILKFFTNITFDIQFPSIDYDQIIETLKIIKLKYIKRISIACIVSNTTKIGTEFKNNTLINKVIINPPVEFIAPEAFRGCIFLYSVTIPETVTSIERSTFSMCEKLENVTILGKISSIGFNAFRGAHKLKQIFIPPSVIEIGKSCFRGDNGLEKVILPSNLVSLKDSVFKGCVLLREIIIPPNVKIIESGAFEECVKLSKIFIPPSVEVIKDDAFKCCVALSCVNFDPSKTKIEKNAFFDCKNLKVLFINTSESSFFMDIVPFPFVKEIVIPKNVTSIQNQLHGITITDSELNIGDHGINAPFSNDSIGRLGVDSDYKC